MEPFQLLAAQSSNKFAPHPLPSFRLGPCSALSIVRIPMLSWHRSGQCYSLSLSCGSFQVHRIVDIPLKYEGTYGRYASGCVSTTRNYRGNWHCTPMHRFPEREKPTEKRTFFCFVMGAHSPPIFLVWEFSDVENPGSIYGRFFF